MISRRVINFKFPLQPYQEYYITLENLAFHSLQKIILPILTTSLIYFSFRRLGECTFLNLEVKGLTLSLPRVINLQFPL